MYDLAECKSACTCECVKTFKFRVENLSKSLYDRKLTRLVIIANKVKVMMNLNKNNRKTRNRKKDVLKSIIYRLITELSYTLLYISN